MDWYALFNRVLVGPFVRRRAHVTVIGRENLPMTGAFILAMGSHVTEVESLVVAATLQERQLHFYAKVQYWRRGGVRGQAQRWFMGAVGHIPVERGEGRAALAAIDAGVQLLRQSGVLAVYPEGTRVSDGKLHGAYPGTAHTLLEAIRTEYVATGTVLRIPIVPVGLIGMQDVASPHGGFVPRCGAATISIGQPMYLSRAEFTTLTLGGRLAQRALTKELTVRMMRRIAQLSGKEYDPHPLPIPGSN